MQHIAKREVEEAKQKGRRKEKRIGIIWRSRRIEQGRMWRRFG